MIKKLSIKRFKSIKDLELECGRVNVFIGEPNTGKSNILEALGLLSYGCYGSGEALRSFVRFESLDDLFYDRILDEEVKIEALHSNELSEVLRVYYQDLRFKCECERKWREELKKHTLFDYDFGGFGTAGYVSELQPFKFYRFLPKSEFERPESDFLLPPHGSNLLSLLMGSKDIKSLVTQIFERFGLKLVFNPTKRRIEVLKQYEDSYVLFPYALVSETLQRTIFYLAAVKSNKDSVLVFEEPEAHAFPFYTKYLAERIALDESNQYFISTHNPYMLNSIIEKGRDVKVFLTHIKDYQTKVKPLSEGELEKVLDLDLDVFFKIERFL